MSAPINGKRSFRLRYLLALLPIALGGLCCWSVLRPSDPAGALEAAQEFDTEFLRSLDGIDESNVEAYAIERRAGVIETGFLLTTVNVTRSNSGSTTFEAALINLGQYPVGGGYATLRLFDDAGRLVETVDLKGSQRNLEAGRGQVVTGEYQVGTRDPRIVEETIVLDSDETTYFTVYSYNGMKSSPGFLSRLAAILPFVGYRAVWTRPELDWNSFKVEFHYDAIIKN